MVSSLVFALLATDPFARYDAFRKAHPTFVATVEVSLGGRVLGTGIAKVNRPQRIRFDLIGPGVDFGLSSTENGYVELDRIEKTYDEHPATGGLRLYESRLSPASGFFPHYLLPPTAEALFGNVKPTITSVEGGDEIKIIVKTQMGESETRMVVDAQGRPVKFSEKSMSGSFQWKLISFVSGSADLSNYRLEAPLGYVPFALPDLPSPLSIGENAPLTGWVKNGKPFDLGEPQRGQTRLLVVLGSDSPPSKAVRPALADLAKSMPVLVIGPGEITDPSGTLMKRLSPPGTPMFYLVGPSERVANLWLGFDPTKVAAWEAEVKTAAVAAK